MEQLARKYTRTKKINGNTYTIKPLGGMQALRHGRTLAKVIMPLMGGGLDGLRESEWVETPRSFTNLALVLCEQIDKVDVELIIHEMLDESTCNSKQISDIDDQFRGDFKSFLELLAFALEENFGELFTGKSGLLAKFTGMFQNLLGDTQDLSD